MDPALTSPSTVAWNAWGRPAMTGCATITGICRLCGARASSGRPFDAWAGPTFIFHHDCIQPGGAVACEPCIAAMSKRQFNLPGWDPKPGKRFGAFPSSLSHGFDEGEGYWNASKGMKPRIAAFLASQKRGAWFLGVADSGQKHVLPFTPMNPARRLVTGDGIGGFVRFETRTLTVPMTADRHIEAVCSLLTDGATKAEVETGHYSPRAWATLGAERIRGFEGQDWVRAHRGGAWWSLLIWVSQRADETTTDDEDTDDA